MAGIVIAVLTAVPPGLSYLLSVVNHNSFYDYSQLWFYYTYLGWAVVVVMIGGLVWILKKRV
jgi:hypothetical protein